MSQLLVQQYLSDIERLKRFSGLSNEQVIRPAFRRLLDQWASSQKLVFLEEYRHETNLKTVVYPDGTVLHDIRVPLGYWEAKDTDDNLEEEIVKKFRSGYPQDNIIFENSELAVLYQNRQEVTRCSMTDVDALVRLLNLFFAYQRPEIAEFRRAVEKFKADLPAVLDALRSKIDAAYARNPSFREAADKFLEHAKTAINPSVEEADVREMLIQHILTEEIFTHVFDYGDFHRENNIARALYDLEGKFFRGPVKRDTLKALEQYYATIRANAALITSHHEKQTFLKVIYENFYKIYNPKAADRLGVVYTPNEIVKFMIEGADWLCHKHFGKTLIDRDVEILDPATGTGTFICELIEYFGSDKLRLAQKYKQELHANEVAILPYYVANLNIEATYYGMTTQYQEFENLCFVDTLDNVTGLGIKTGQHVGDLFGALTEENVERVRRQNNRKISVIIGNPPYNANQANENLNNKNRAYPHIDKLIKESYIKFSKAQKQKTYDPYTRFFRWASDRMHDDGVLAFITNRSFIDKHSYDGFRRAVEREFNEIYVVDLGGDVRDNRRLSGTKHNVFGIQIGVAISFMVKRRKQQGCKIFYARRPEFDTAKDKLSFLSSTKASDIAYHRVEPDKDANWVNLADTGGEGGWDSLPPVATKAAKAAKLKVQEKALFRLFSLGVATNRDEWVYDASETILAEKVSHFINVYNSELERWIEAGRPKETGSWVSREIKWTSELEARLKAGKKLTFNPERIRKAAYRPFSPTYTYYDRVVTHRLYRQEEIFPIDTSLSNPVIIFTGPAAQKPWMVSAVDRLPDLHYVGAAAGAVCLPRYRYSSDGERLDNITDWAMRRFREVYGRNGIKAASLSTEVDRATGTEASVEQRSGSAITKDDIFAYVYGVLHDPTYRETYNLNLKREFPKIPFHKDFWQWVEWGQRLLTLHIGFEAIEPWPLERHDGNDPRAAAAGVEPIAVLKADLRNCLVRVDSDTYLSGFPPEVWDFQLGSRSALGWVLDQAKKRQPEDPTVRKMFDRYRFSDHKEKIIDLIGRVTRVSVETMAILKEVADAKDRILPPAASAAEALEAEQG